MALPYPLEVETGQLKSGRPVPRQPFDVVAHVREAIVASGSGVDIFGVRYPVAHPERAEALAQQWRAAVTVHFNERVSAPDQDLWRSFVEQVSAQLDHHAELDDSALEVLRLTIDNL